MYKAKVYDNEAKGYVDPFANVAWPGLHVPPINLYNVPKREGDSREAMKFDQGKARMELIDPLAMQGLAKVLEFGANKYAVDNWRKGFPLTRIIGSLERHLNAIKAGEDTDPESGLPHIDHVGCNWMFLSFFMKRRLDLDDRWYTTSDNRPPVVKQEESPSETLSREWRD